MPLRLAHIIDLARAALELDIGQHRNLRGVPIEFVVRRELVVPLQLAGIGVERDHRGTVQVVAQARIAVPIRTGIPGSPEGQIGFRIVGTGHPDGRAAVHPGIVGFAVLAEPGLIAGLAGSGTV